MLTFPKLNFKGAAQKVAMIALPVIGVSLVAPSFAQAGSTHTEKQPDTVLKFELDSRGLRTYQSGPRGSQYREVTPTPDGGMYERGRTEEIIQYSPYAAGSNPPRRAECKWDSFAEQYMCCDVGDHLKRVDRDAYVCEGVQVRRHREYTPY